MNTINGLVLSGGLSSRMGSDKGLLLLNNKPWFKIAAEKLSPFCDKTFISIRKDQQPLYQAHQPFSSGMEFIFDRDELEIAGPAAGIISAHLYKPSCDWFVLSSDMLNITPGIISTAIDTRQKSSSYDACLFSPGERLEPLCGIYTAEGLEKLTEKILFTRNYSLTAHLNQMNVSPGSLKDISVENFKSFNTANDLDPIK
jgi:molybdopterin-guanine dinucleotide biosynthesis protein A